MKYWKPFGKHGQKEASLKYIDTIIQHISVGILSFDNDGKIELINPAAFRLLGIYRLRYIDELKHTHPELPELMMYLEAGHKSLFATQNGQQLSINAASVRLQGRLVKLISIQNIHAELQRKELEAWQNLTKILRHEIMNSITPIVSLIGTMTDIVDYDITPLAEPGHEAVTDLKEALQTVESRSKGIMNFVNAYRDYTTLPEPQFTQVSLKTLINSVSNLLQSDICVRPASPTR
ncbi:PAS domain-containing protein [Chitinophaga sedimenti]|uniref:sensor histidine kinase n=1 Tax=Chitinophaga sedimenti TaxID=2033606 RepID=UPI00200346D5|nr:PAS domain-containing protein [Chitinophaga sedimenti]MCK7558867.1 PAS domain-containing protein [Chitinophaga sedimenti]